MIDSSTEQLLTVKEATKFFPNRPSIPSVWRWMLKGCKGVILESMRIGGRRYTRREACVRFLERLTTNKRISSEARDAIEHSRAELDRMGV